MTCPRVLLLLDEPTEDIQPSIIKDIGRVIALLGDEGRMASVLVEQYFDFALQAADNVCTLRIGRVTFQSRAKDLNRARLLKEISLWQPTSGRCSRLNTSKDHSRTHATGRVAYLGFKVTMDLKVNRTGFAGGARSSLLRKMKASPGGRFLNLRRSA